MGSAGVAPPDQSVQRRRAFHAPTDFLDAAALGRPDAIVRDRRHVADGRDLEADRLEGAKGALTTRTGALHFHLEGADAMVGGLLAREIGRASCRERVCQYL